MVKNIDVTIKFLSKVFPLLYQGQFFVKVDGLYLNFLKEIFHTPLYIQGHFFAFHNRNTEIFFCMPSYNKAHLSLRLFWKNSQ